MALDVVLSRDWSLTRFFQCILHILLTCNTNDKSKKCVVNRSPEDTTSYLSIYIYIYILSNRHIESVLSYLYTSMHISKVKEKSPSVIELSELICVHSEAFI